MDNPHEQLLSLPPFVVNKLPKSDVCNEALKLAWLSLPEPIFNHSLRVFLIAQWHHHRSTENPTLPVNPDLLFVACIYHDLGASDHFNGSQRFEVEGADAAKEHPIQHGFTEEDSHQAWIAIAVHTSPGIAEKIGRVAQLVREGVMMDFSTARRKEMDAEDFSAEIETYLPRLGIEKVLGDAVVGQAPHCHDLPSRTNWPNTQKHPAASWPGILLRASLENPGHNGINPAF